MSGNSIRLSTPLLPMLTFTSDVLVLVSQVMGWNALLRSASEFITKSQASFLSSMPDPPTLSVSLPKARQSNLSHPYPISFSLYCPSLGLVLSPSYSAEAFFSFVHEKDTKGQEGMCLISFLVRKDRGRTSVKS